MLAYVSPKIKDSRVLTVIRARADFGAARQPLYVALSAAAGEDAGVCRVETKRVPAVACLERWHFR